MAKRGSKLNAKAKKSGLSVAKKTNIRKAKASKQGKLSTGQKKVKKEANEKKKKSTFAELKEKSKRTQIHQEREKKNASKSIPSARDMMAMMDPDDLNYLISTENAREEKEDQEKQKAKKKLKKELKEVKKLSKGDDKTEDKQGRKRKRKPKKRKIDLNDDDVEENYEQGLTDLPDAPKMRKLLPIKTSKGIVKREIEVPEKEIMDDADSGVLDDIDSHVPATVSINDQPKEEEMKVIKSAVELLVERQQKLEEKKIQIGCYSSNFIENPIERMTSLSGLIHFLSEPDHEISATVKKLTALSLLEVFHNTLPSYRIRSHDLSTE